MDFTRGVFLIKAICFGASSKLSHGDYRGSLEPLIHLIHFARKGGEIRVVPRERDRQISRCVAPNCIACDSHLFDVTHDRTSRTKPVGRPRSPPICLSIYLFISCVRYFHFSSGDRPCIDRTYLACQTTHANTEEMSLVIIINLRRSNFN